ncbi:MAG: hypothetical protein JOZ69_16510 [Myxococcales bacterium]|nr:hypothetical protein [Myxococcales bacterium]
MRVARIHGCVLVAAALAAFGFTGSARAASPRAEAAAADALRKAEGDFLVMNYASAAARLDRALRGCAPANCYPTTQAALLRDIGTMEFRAGDRGFAVKAFGDALRLQPSIELNPSYDSPDLRAVWNEVKGEGAPAPAGAAPAAPPAAPAAPPPPPAPTVPPPPTFPQPSGDFTHTPAREQRIDTPLPIYIEGGPPGVTHVVVRYKSQAQGDESEWGHMNLARVGNGWGGMIPCASVIAGTVRYYIQAYNKDMDPVASNGDAKHPYQVPVREELFGEPSHLPGRAPPHACHVAPKRKVEPPPAPVAATAPGLSAPAASSAHAQAADTAAEPEEEESASQGAGGECTPGTAGCPKTRADAESARGAGPDKASRLWIGASLSLDIFSIPSGDNLCLLQPSGPNAGEPLNDKFIYCTDPGNQDFPTRDPAVGRALNQQLHDLGQAGHSDGGTVVGTMHIALSADYAFVDNFLIGGRAGITVGTFPGQAASTDGHAAKLPILYLEARLTWVPGHQPFARGGLAPMVFVGAGYGEFDGHTSGVARAPGMTNGSFVRVPVNFWVTSGPFFGALGAGIRYALPGTQWVGSLALRANLAANGSGVVPSLGPDVAIQYGF